MLRVMRLSDIVPGLEAKPMPEQVLVVINSDDDFAARLVAGGVGEGIKGLTPLGKVEAVRYEERRTDHTFVQQADNFGP